MHFSAIVLMFLCAVTGPDGRAEQLKLKEVEFRDRDMGNVVSHTMVIPESWTAAGGIAWSQGDVIYPQQQIEVRSPDGLRIAFVPGMNLFYSQTDPNWIAQVRQMGLDQGNLKEEDGMRPPEDVGPWVVDFVRQNNHAVSDVKLISQQRDQKFEEAMAKFGNPGNANFSAHVICIEYVKDGVRTREEITLSLSVLPPVESPQSKFTMWSVMVSVIVSAPAEKFDQAKTLLYSIANTMRSTPQWWNGVQQTLAEINRIRQQGAKMRADQMAEAIRRRGETYSQISDDQMASWKRQQATEDEMQRRRINGINETADYWLPDNNSSVKLPGLYKNAYRTKQGDYIVTDLTLESPELQQLKERQ